MAGVDGVAHGLSSSWSGLKRPLRSLETDKKNTSERIQKCNEKDVKGHSIAYRMSKNGDWERPEKVSITPVEGSAPDREAPGGLIVMVSVYADSGKWFFRVHM